MKFSIPSFVFSMGALFVLFTATSWNPNSPPTVNTGAPGETTCAKSNCHSGGTFTGTVSISGIPDTVEYNKVYPITITNTSNAVRAGFQLTCLDSLNDKCGNLASATGVNIGSGSGRQYARQSQPKTLAAGSTSWTFNWTAPATASGAEGVFYFVTLCANNNGQRTGDNVLLGNKAFVFKQALTTAVQEPNWAQGMRLFPTAADNWLQVEFHDAFEGQLFLFDAAGRQVQQTTLSSSNTIALDALSPGIYFAKIQSGRQAIVRKFVRK
jgi:Secretion system C-terminal sorting domain